MAKKIDSFQQKISRNDRFAQMSQQEKIIEQKKKEILAKIEAKELASKAEKAKSTSDSSKSTNKNGSTNQKEVKNIFSNDGSFLDQFKQLKDKSRIESKIKSFGNSKENSDKTYSEEKNKLNRWVPRRRSPSPKDHVVKRFSRFSKDKGINFEPKITINTSFSSAVTAQNFDVQNRVQAISVAPHDVTGQPLLKNMLPQETNFPKMTTEIVQTVITSPSVLLDVPPPQIVQGQISNTLVLTPASTQNVLVSTSLQPILTTVNLPTLVTTNVTPQASIQQVLPVPPPCLPTIELASIPPPNPIQLQNIPPPEPLNTLNIPQPAPIQVQNIPTPNQIQLNEIPNPKPIDLLTIPTPNEDKGISDPGFLKNIPPPNKAVPPPQIQESSVTLMPAVSTVTTTITVPSTQNVLVHNIPPPQIHNMNMQGTPPNVILQNPTNFTSVTMAVPVGVVQVSSAPAAIPSLMAQPVLPPPGMGLNVNCPPPILPGNSLQQPSGFVSQGNSLQSMPPMSIPPPSSMPGINTVATLQGFKNMNAVFPPGSPEYESMASLGRTVAECGESIEDIVRQGKNQDPNLWFLFHKDSAAYQQYRQLVEQFKHEKEMKRKMEENQENECKPKPEDIYEPEIAFEDYDMIKSEIKHEIKDEIFDGSERSERKRKRRSRWGDKAVTIPPPSVINYTPPTLAAVIPNIPKPNQQGPMMLSKVTRTDPALLHYVANTYGTTNLSDEDWKKAEDNFKIHLLYQDMLAKREEVERLQRAGKNKYEYDSDEETEGGTWEHKAREKEMMATQLWAQELNRQAEGKHHIGDFLPPDELKKFMEKSSAAKEGRLPNFSDYKEFKIKEDNIGFKMLQKLGWTEGEGLGSSGSGIVEPVNKAPPREHTQGLGLNQIEEDEDEYESYRKRMMLAYRFRPNPLNNPRRPYY